MSLLQVKGLLNNPLSLFTKRPNWLGEQTFGGGDEERGLYSLLADGNTVAWYRPGIGVTGTLNASAWANQLGAAGSLEQATGANQPIYLPFAGAKYLYAPDLTTNGATTPDAVPLDVTSLDIKFRIALDDWTPSANQLPYGKATSFGATTMSWYVNISATTGIVQLIHADGTSTFINSSTVAPTIANGSALWIRITMEPNVAGSHNTKFYTAADQTSVPTSWTQLGTTVTGAASAGLHNSTSPLGVGAIPAFDSFAGKVYYAEMSAFGGSPVSVFNAADWPETSTNGATQVSSTTGETWTLNNTGALLAQIVGSPSLLFDGTADFMATGAETLDQPITAYLVGRQVTWTDNDVILDGVTADTLGLKQTTTTPSISLNAGAEAAEDANLTLGLNSVITVVLNGASSSIKVNANAATTGNAGAGNPSGLVLGAVATPGSYGNIQVKELIIRNVADNTATQAKIQRRLRQIHGTPA